VIVAVLFAAVSAYYYFRIIQAMYFKEATQDVIQTSDITIGFKLVLIITVLLILALGIYPELVLGWMYH
jgi:NADH-quinone oxidoreductase subunit N